MNIEPLGAKAMSVGKLNGPPPCVTFFHAAELKSSAGTPVSERAPFSPMVCNNFPSVVNFWNCLWCSSHSQTTSCPFSQTMRIACGKVNSPAPQDDRKLPSRSKITTGCSALRLKQYTRSCESTETAQARTSSPAGGRCHSSLTRYVYLPLPTIGSMFLLLCALYRRVRSHH